MGLPVPDNDPFSQPPPAFGHELLRYFAFEPGYINLNNGSYGAVPLPVLNVCNKIALQIEANPDRFLRLIYQDLLNESRAQIAQLIGAKTNEVVLVHNASTGLNTVLRNIEWEEGDIIIDCNTTYGSISRTVQSLSDTRPHPTVSHFSLLFPTSHAEIIARFHEHIRSLPRTHADGTSRRRVAVIDSIVSNPGVLLPWKELVKLCREEGVLSVIDAAHSIGQEQHINLAEAQPDFWVSNCHKWLSVKRGCAVLYIPERNQNLIKSSFPSSAFYESLPNRSPECLIRQFEWNGTIDFVPWLTVPSALAFRRWIGGEAKIDAYCHDLAIKGGKKLAEIFGTSVLDPEGDLTLHMVNVELPFPGKIQYTSTIDELFKRKLLEERKAYSAHFYHNGKWWTRCSAQIWNNFEDFEKIGKIWVEVCKEVIEELRLEV